MSWTSDPCWMNNIFVLSIKLCCEIWKITINAITAQCGVFSQFFFWAKTPQLGHYCVGTWVVVFVEKRTSRRVQTLLLFEGSPLLASKKCAQRLVKGPKCSTEECRRSLLPTVVKLVNDLWFLFSCFLTDGLYFIYFICLVFFHLCLAFLFIPWLIVHI